MPVFVIFYGEMFDVNCIELKQYSSVVAYIRSVLAVKVSLAICCRLEGPGVEPQWGQDSLPAQSKMGGAWH